MRIVHVVRQYAPSIGGLEAVVAELAAQQSRRGHDVRVITLDRVFGATGPPLPARETIDGIPVERLRWAGSTRYPLCPQVLWHLGDAEVVHVHAIDFFFDWLALTRFVHGKRLVVSTHGGFFHTGFASTLKRLWFGTITRLSALAYRRVVATSDNDGVVFSRIAPRHVVVVENGADIERFRDAANAVVVPTLIFFGRWSSNKGIEALIELVAALRQRDPRWRLVIGGRPYDLSARQLSQRIASLGLHDAVELEESPSDATLRALMTRASYFACLSRHEGFGIAAIEAMSAGLLPVLSDIAPFRKIVEAAHAGILLPLGQAAAESADRILSLHRSRSDDDTDDRRQRIAFTRRYEWAAVADRYEAVYREVVGDVAVASRASA